MMDNRWLVGFIEGEGCFSLNLRRNKTATYGIQPVAEVIIAQDDYECLKKISLYFQKEIGFLHEPYIRERPRKNGKIGYELRISRKSDVKKLADWLLNEKFETKKRLDFEGWNKGIELTKQPRGRRVSYSPIELVEFAGLATSINRGKSSMRKYTPEVVAEIINSVLRAKGKDVLVFTKGVDTSRGKVNGL